MRYIAKPQDSPADLCIRGFIETQMAGRGDGTPWEELQVDYEHFTRSAQLRPLLIEEQKGICAYTGVGVDERLAQRQPENQAGAHPDYWFTPHIEHIKSQKQCRQELVEQGRVVGRDVGEDLAYPNLVAAVEVSGAPEEHFGAAFRGTEPIPISPTKPACATAFLYAENGDVLGLSEAAQATRAILKLDHPTLNGWSSGAIRGLLPLGPRTPRATLEMIIERLEDDTVKPLPEFSFVIAQIARFHLASQA